MNRDALKIKEEIISILQRNGPSLPAQIAKKIEQSILFTSAFLSELFSEKRIKISHLKIGSSPLYFLEGQEQMLEKFVDELKSKEKEAFLLLKEKKFLKDSELDPPIRVALRSIRDFSVPFKFNNEIFWRFFSNSEQEFYKKIEEEKSKIFKEKIKETDQPPMVLVKEKNEKKKSIKKTIKIKGIKRERKNENFFNKVKEFVSSNGAEILDILDFRKNELILKVKKNQEEKIFFAFNKKKISEKDIIKATKKASEYNINYEVIFLGKLPKKLEEFIKAVKGLSINVLS